MKTNKCKIEGKPSSDLFYEEANRIDYQILDGVDNLEPLDVAEDLHWTDLNLSFEEALMQALMMDRLYLLVDEKGNIIGHDFYDKGRNVNEYIRLEYPELEYEWMKDDFDKVDEGEWECIMAEEMERFETLRTNILELHITDTNELCNLLQSKMDETTYRLKIHFTHGGRKFLIIGTDMLQFCWYKVLLESGSGKNSRLKYIGSDCYPNSVLMFINYYLETGQPLYGI